jgi:hypothetical protein
MDTLLLVKGLLFLLGTAGLAYLSRASLAVPRSHGFYRFFAWEAILALFLLNVDVWFRDPFSWHQILSWALLVISALLVIGGIRLLTYSGAPDAARDDVPMMAFEKTTRLVTTGLYRYIRHPLQLAPFSGLGHLFQGPLLARRRAGGRGDPVPGGDGPRRRSGGYPLLRRRVSGIHATQPHVCPVPILKNRGRLAHRPFQAPAFLYPLHRRGNGTRHEGLPRLGCHPHLGRGVAPTIAGWMIVPGW